MVSFLFGSLAIGYLQCSLLSQEGGMYIILNNTALN